MTTIPPLTPHAVLTLRASVRWRGQVDIDAGAATLVTYSASERAFQLSAYGRVMALSPDPLPLCAMLVQERAESGFIARLLDTAVDPETACLDPAQRAARITQINAAKALTRQHTETTAANRRLQALRPSSVSLDDLLND